MSDWKQHHADEAEKAVIHDLVAGVIDEQMDNLNRSDPLARYGLMKIAHYAATVARAQALGFDPELLKVTASEAESEQLRVAAEATLRGIPVYMLDGGPA